MPAKKIQVALLAGGKSAERQVSLAGAKAVIQALDHQKYEIHRYDPATDLAKLAREAHNLDVAFVLLHGTHGEDGTVQGFLDLLDLPYQGSGVLGSALAMDKNLAKEIYQMHGLPVADWRMLSPEDINNPTEVLTRLKLPLVIKPVRQGSSIGMGIAHTEKEFCLLTQNAFKHDTEVMAEQFLSGREITVGILGNDHLTPLPLVEIIPGESHPFFDYTAKYEAGASNEICPADLPAKLTQKAQQYALTAHKILRLRGYSRTDMMIAENNDIFLLETNTIPGMTTTSLFPQAALAHGLPFPQLLDHLLTLAMEKE